ncbi:MAG: molecular chaperone DnaK [Candidatus Doudnabacteria bacterium]|nr:molecular chaperone DnaK [Candidatus Doudnabacteria bacterium]
MGKVIGIDLGTTNSAVAVMLGGKPEVITNKEGMRTTPSVIAISVDTKDEIVGMTAKNQMVTNPEQTFYSVKRLIGMEYSDPAIAEDLKTLPYKTRKNKKGGVEIQFGEEWVAPEAISAKVLAKIKRDAEAFLGETVTDAVVTVPAYFNDSQRQATKNAGKIAGLNVLRIINEPTAAALAYGLDKNKEATIAVYDLGGGTFDISILEIGDGVFEVKSTNGDTHLGGDDFDQRIIQYLVDEFKKEQGIDLKEDAAALQRLKEAAEKAKITLSSAENTEINLPYITADAKGPKHMRLTLTRSQLEKIVMDLVEQTTKPIDKALKDAGVSKSDIDDVVLVGGMTRMPLVLKTVKEYFGRDPHQGVNPDEVVAVGAAIQGAVLAGDQSVQDITLLDVTPLSLGIEVNYGEMHVMIPRNTTIPTEKTEDMFTTAADNQTAIDIKVLQGERPMAADNKVLGTFRLDDIPSAPRGVPRFAVTFKIDANGILNVSAKDVKTNKEQSITITASTQLDESEVERLVKEAAENASKDKEKQERSKVRNEAETLAYQAEKLTRDHGDKIPAEDKTKLEEEAKKLAEMAKKEDFDQEELKKANEEFTQLLQNTGAKIYEQAPGEAGSEPADTTNPGGDDDSSKAKKDDPAAEGEVV